jgi:hypothetical protein
MNDRTDRSAGHKKRAGLKLALECTPTLCIGSFEPAGLFFLQFVQLFFQFGDP